MTASHSQSIGSGKPYPVAVPPAGGGGPSLDAFLGDAQFIIDTGGEPLPIQGHGVSHGEFVRFHEKDTLGGKDVRVWHIAERDGSFVAETIAAF